MTSRTSLLLAVSALAVALPAAGSAFAQQAEPAATEVDDIVVTAAPYGVNARATTIALEVVDQEQLLTGPSAGLGDVLNGLPGVRTTSFSAGASRPVIRGMAGPRVQVLNNGLGMIDASALSPDHQVAADPGEATRIEVLRGAQTLAYGGSAIGGVVNVIDNRIPSEAPEDGLDGHFSAQASSVDDGYNVGGGVAIGSGPLVFTLDARRREQGDYDIPVDAESYRQTQAEGEAPPNRGRTTLENSFVNLDAYGAGVSWIGSDGFLGVSVKRTETDYGVPGHAHEHEDEDHDHEGEDHDHDHEHEEEGSVTIGLEQTRYDLRGELNRTFGPFRALRLSAGYADYTHTEFEGEEIGTVFTSSGYEGRLEMIQTRRGGWEGAVGVQGLHRDFDAQGDEAYVPQTTIEELGAYTMQRLDLGAWGLEGGLRVDHRHLDSLAGERHFNNVSGSASVFVKPATGLFFGLSVSSNGRAPTEAELFANGPHVATRGFEIGVPDLDSERVLSVEGSAHVDLGPWSADLHIFNAEYDGFIDVVATGDEEDGLAVYRYVQTDATFRGLEAEATYRFWEEGEDHLDFGFAYDTVRGETDMGPPARIPPWSATLKAEAKIGAFEGRLELRHVGEQDRVAEYELPTDSYRTLGAFVGWRPTAERDLLLYVDGRNLTDEEVREHASFLKDLAPSPGRNIRVGVAWQF